MDEIPSHLLGLVYQCVYLCVSVSVNNQLCLSLDGTRLPLAPPATIGGAKGSHDAKDATDNVSESDWNDGLDHHLGNTNFGSTHDSEGDDEHVGDRVVQAKGDKGRDGEPDGRHLAGHAAASGGHVDSHADEPVAEDSADKGHAKGKGALGRGNGGSGRGVTEGFAREGQPGEEKGSDKVSEPRGDPTLDEFSPLGLSLVDSGSDECRVAGEELSSRDESHDETEWQAKGTEDHLDPTRNGVASGKGENVWKKEDWCDESTGRTGGGGLCTMTGRKPLQWKRR